MVVFAILSSLHFGCLLAIGAGQLLMSSFPRCGRWMMLLASTAGSLVLAINFACGLSGLDPAFAFRSQGDFMLGVAPDCPTMGDSVCRGGGWAEFPAGSCVAAGPRWNCDNTIFVACEEGNCMLNCSAGTCMRCKLSDCSVSGMFAWLRALPAMNSICIVMIVAALWRVSKFVREVRALKADPEQMNSLVAEVLSVVVKTAGRTHYSEITVDAHQ
jgi:hypothetical protein